VFRYPAPLELNIVLRLDLLVDSKLLAFTSVAIQNRILYKSLVNSTKQ
jgi:hypothetical protein